MNELTLLNRIFNQPDSVCVLDAQQLYALNDTTMRRGLSLTREQPVEAARLRLNALYENERVELGVGAARKLLLTFCHSSYVSTRNWAELVFELMERFYFIKSEIHDLISDNLLIDYLFHCFEGSCCGALELMLDESEELIRRVNSDGAQAAEVEIELADKVETLFSLSSLESTSERAALYDSIAACYFEIKGRLGGRLNDYAILGEISRELTECGGELSDESVKRVLHCLEGGM